MIRLTGGGDDFPQQQQQMILPSAPPEPQRDALDYWALGVVPILVALIAVWHHRRSR